MSKKTRKKIRKESGKPAGPEDKPGIEGISEAGSFENGAVVGKKIKQELKSQGN